MGNRRKKSAVTIRKNVEEMRYKLEQMEAELEAAKEERYSVVGMYFYEAFADCPAFDILVMSDSKIRNFMEMVRWYYDCQTWRNGMSEVPEITDEVLDDWEGTSDPAVCVGGGKPVEE